jgi:hypothetical protein
VALLRAETDQVLGSAGLVSSDVVWWGAVSVDLERDVVQA